MASSLKPRKFIMQKTILLGNLGRDPEVRRFPDGGMVANVGIATTEKWRDKQTGDLKELTEWHSVVFRGRLAEVVEKTCRKGTRIYVEGKLRSRKWTDDQGVERKVVELYADDMELQPGGERNGSNASGDDRCGNTPQHPQQPPSPAQHEQAPRHGSHNDFPREPLF